MTHGTAVHGTGTPGHILHGDTTDGMIHITTEDGTTHGTTVILIIADGTEDGIHIGDIITTTISLEARRRIETSGMAAATRAAQTECSQAECLHVEAHQAAR